MKINSITGVMLLWESRSIEIPSNGGKMGEGEAEKKARQKNVNVRFYVRKGGK